MKRRTLIGVVLAVLGALLALYAVRGTYQDAQNASEPSAKPVIRVQVGVLERKTLHRYVTGYGVVEPAPATPRRPAADAAVAAPINGVVTRVLVAAGERVHRGELLVELNSDAMTERYAAAEVRRERRLYAQHNTSLKALQQAEAQLALLRVRAPLTGTLVRVKIRPGAAVNTNTVLADIVDLRRLVVRTEIPAAEASELKLDQPVEVEIRGDAPVITRVGYISPTVDPSDGAVSVWAALPAARDLRPGGYVGVRIITATHRDVLAAPTASVVTGVSGRSVLSIVHGEEAIRVPVRAGLRENGWVEVSGAGLRAGTRIVTIGAYGLPERVAIEIEPASADSGVAGRGQGAATP